VLHQLKEHPETAQIPVIIISADSTPLQIDKLLISGASNYLTKPIDLKSFSREISKHLFKKNKN
jgi:response regulator RpfG family c-di-GMP phosphodiesterase